MSYQADEALQVTSISLLEDLLGATDAGKGYVIVPVREGLLVPADSGLSFTHRFGTFEYEGCHMEMLGIVQGGAAVMITWHDPYVAAELKSAVAETPSSAGRQRLSASLVLGKSAKSFRIRLLGQGDYVTIGKAYRQVAQEKGWLVTWDEKLKDHPERAKLFGAVNYKLWSTLDRRMNEESTKEESVRVNWTFDEAAQVAEHLKRDLKLDKVLFIMGGWIHRGYDNQHPDILPTAPECGGDAAFADCARRVRNLGYLFCLHDNYQDIYRDSPSWDENLIMKNADGTLALGGRWAGGRAYLTCSQMALDLAQRPQNLPAVKDLSAADAYFIDTTYAAGLQECFDPAHPLTRWRRHELEAGPVRLRARRLRHFRQRVRARMGHPAQRFLRGPHRASAATPTTTRTCRASWARPWCRSSSWSIATASRCTANTAMTRSAPPEYVLHHISLGAPAELPLHPTASLLEERVSSRRPRRRRMPPSRRVCAGRRRLGGGTSPDGSFRQEHP